MSAASPSPSPDNCNAPATLRGVIVGNNLNASATTPFSHTTPNPPTPKSFRFSAAHRYIFSAYAIDMQIYMGRLFMSSDK
jgi:hypothetical protein